MEVRAQLLAIGLAQHGAASGSEHSVGRGCEFSYHVLLDIAKACLAFALEKLADRAADALFDQKIAVDERKLQALREAPPDCRLAGAGQPDECDCHALAAKAARQRAALRSVIIFGVIKTSISVLLATRLRVRNSAPT